MWENSVNWYFRWTICDGTNVVREMLFSHTVTDSLSMIRDSIENLNKLFEELIMKQVDC